MHDNATSGWLPAALNRGWTYRDRVRPPEAGLTASAFYALRHPHSSEGVWRQRLAAGEIALSKSSQSVLSSTVFVGCAQDWTAVAGSP